MPSQPRPSFASRAHRFKRLVRDKFFVRFHMTIILACVVAAGVLASKLMLMAGVTHMALRWMLSVVAGYLVFLLGVRAWIGYARSCLPSKSQVFDMVDLASGSMGQRAKKSDEGLQESVDVPDPFPFDLFDMDEGGLVLIVVGLVALLLLGAGIYVVWQAPLILSEAALQVVLAASLKPGANRIDQPGWKGGVWRATWKPLILVMIGVVIAGFVAQGLCPGAVRLAEVILFLC